MDARQPISGRLISERRAAAGLTVRQLADQLGIDARTLADFERAFTHDAGAMTVGLLLRICQALDLELAEVIDPPTAAPQESADDRKVEAALVEHGGVLTRDDLAAALSWPLARLERALLSLEHRPKPTGLRLRRVGWNSYALGPNLGVLTGEERRRLHRTHSGRVGLAESVAFILLGVVSGYRSQDWLLRLPADDRGGIELLARQGLIEPSSQDRWQPTADVLYSLCLRDGDDGETATPRRLLNLTDSLVALLLTRSCASADNQAAHPLTFWLRSTTPTAALVGGGGGSVNITKVIGDAQ